VASDEKRPDLEAAMRRFFALAPVDQLRAYEQMREFLAAASRETKADRELRERIEALEAIKAVADHLGLPAGRTPTAEQFNEVARDVAPSWNTSRVARAWESWRFAGDVYRGERPRLSSHQRSLRTRLAGRQRTREEHLTAIREWLETKPLTEGSAAYLAWRNEMNGQLKEGLLPYPHLSSVCRAYAIGWPDLIRVAKGELSLEEARTRSRPRRDEFSRGPHELVSIRWVANRLKVAVWVAGRASYKPEFPTPVAKIGPSRVWLREDVDAYADGRSFPEREPYELQHLYADAVEAAGMLGLTPKSLHTPRIAAPKPNGRVSGQPYWLKEDVERWIRDNPLEANRRLRSGTKLPVNRK
jgi:hypothetical protein